MAAATFSARAVALMVAKRGVKCDAKRVRAWSRDHIARLDDDAYTTHAYTAAEAKRIADALVARARPDAKGTTGRASSASRGRKAPSAPKSAPSAPKTTGEAPTA